MPAETSISRRGGGGRACHGPEDGCLAASVTVDHCSGAAGDEGDPGDLRLRAAWLLRGASTCGLSVHGGGVASIEPTFGGAGHRPVGRRVVRDGLLATARGGRCLAVSLPAGPDEVAAVGEVPAGGDLRDRPCGGEQVGSCSFESSPADMLHDRGSAGGEGAVKGAATRSTQRWSRLPPSWIRPPVKSRRCPPHSGSPRSEADSSVAMPSILTIPCRQPEHPGRSAESAVRCSVPDRDRSSPREPHRRGRPPPRPGCPPSGPGAAPRGSVATGPPAPRSSAP
ncbi:hypothetical protein J2Z21_008784 [Streptomyces griseochromogenes]|uniref:Uncharacterized protein n=1 Tax=Streptomyces griseochromogenes TaxID=68214 RepID=A0ABS4M7Z6_9ACTN|nr:hypothetical protein [Streptomyces griseochromogenes]